MNVAKVGQNEGEKAYLKMIEEKREYIKAINKELNRCDNRDHMDLIYKLIRKLNQSEAQS